MVPLTRRGFLGAVAAVALAPVLPRAVQHPTYSDYVHANCGPIDPSWHGMPEWENDGHFRAPYLGISRG